MAFFTAIGQFLKIVFFFLKMRNEKDKKKAEDQAKIGENIVKALKETNPKRRDSAVVSAIDDINRL